MPDQRGAFDVRGDCSPRELANRLGWPRHIVVELIEQGQIVRTAKGWRIDVAAELRRRWARSLWDDTDDTPSESESESASAERPGRPRTEDES